MATSYKTPGVYIEEIPKFPPSVAEVETAIPAFIGYTLITNRVGDVIKPVRITSLIEYETLFGKARLENITMQIRDTMDGTTVKTRTYTPVLADADKPKNTMYYHLQMYFSNGGGPCWIASTGAATNAIAVADLTLGLNAIKKVDEPTLLVFPEGVNLTAASDLYDMYDLALQQAGDLKDRFVVMDCHGDDPATLRDTTGIGMNNLKYGAAYHPFLETSLNYLYDETTITIDHKQNVDTSNPDFEVNVVYGGSSKLSDVLGTTAVSDRSVIYNAVKQSLAGLRITLNPSPTIVGVYAAVDSTRGVWKAPANVSLLNVNAPTKLVSEQEQGDLNVDTVAGKSINVIRAFTGKGILVWGARTLAGNDNEWRYIPVRRFFIMVEESSKKASEQYVFEPNDANTWVKVQGMLENFLTTLWRAGALQGAKPEHAFYVAVGLNKTMSALDILEGRMIVEIGMAVVRPAEFIILRFSHKMAES